MAVCASIPVPVPARLSRSLSTHLTCLKSVCLSLLYILPVTMCASPSLSHPLSFSPLAKAGGSPGRPPRAAPHPHCLQGVRTLFLSQLEAPGTCLRQWSQTVQGHKPALVVSRDWPVLFNRQRHWFPLPPVVGGVKRPCLENAQETNSRSKRERKGSQPLGACWPHPVP